MHRSFAGSAGIERTIDHRYGISGEDPLTCTNYFDTNFSRVGLNEACDATSNKILSEQRFSNRRRHAFTGNRRR